MSGYRSRMLAAVAELLTHRHPSDVPPEGDGRPGCPACRHEWTSGRNGLTEPLSACVAEHYRRNIGGPGAGTLMAGTVHDRVSGTRGRNGS